MFSNTPQLHALAAKDTTAAYTGRPRDALAEWQTQHSQSTASTPEGLTEEDSDQHG